MTAADCCGEQITDEASADSANYERRFAHKLFANPSLNKKTQVRLTRQFYRRLQRQDPNSWLFDVATSQDRDFEFEVEYFDSLPMLAQQATSQRQSTTTDDASAQPKPEARATAKRRTLLFLHGSPGSYKDFASAISYFAARPEFRIVAPNFPNYAHTATCGFRHTPDERLAFLLGFCARLQLAEFDCVIGHSSAMYTMLAWLDLLMKGELATSGDTIAESAPSTNTNTDSNANANTDQTDAEVGMENSKPLFAPNIKMIAAFNSPSHELPPDISETPVRRLAVRLYDNAIFRFLMNTCASLVVKSLAIPNRFDSFDNLLVAASAVGFANKRRVQSALLAFAASGRFAALFVVSGRDKLIPRPFFERFLRDVLRLDLARDVKRYDERGAIAALPDDEPVAGKDSRPISGEERAEIARRRRLVWVSDFASGGHYTFQRFSRQVNADLDEFIEHFSRRA